MCSSDLAKKVSESELDAFKTFNDTDFGEISIAMVLKKSARKGHTNPFHAKNGFEDDVVCFTLIPGFRAENITSTIDKGIKGIIFRAYGSGDIPQSLIPGLLYAKKKKVPVVVTTQCPGGATVMGLNKAGLLALKTGVIQVFDMSMEAMSTKLMWLLAQGVPYQNIKNKMQENMVGEVNPSRAEIFLNMESSA